MREVPGRAALVYLGESFSYARLKDLIDRFATALNGLGVNKGDKVMLYVSNSPQWVIAFFGIQKIGAIAVPVPPIYTSFEIEYMINDSGAETIVCLDTNFCYVKEIFAKTCLKRVIVTNLVDLLPLWKRTVGFLFDKVPRGSSRKMEMSTPSEEMLKYSSPKLSVEIDPGKDLSYILYTGGTTGFPKGVPGNHIGMTSYVQDIMEDVVGGYLKERRRDLYCGQSAFSYHGARPFYGRRSELREHIGHHAHPPGGRILSAMERYRVGWFLGVPALYRMILENDRLDQYHLSSLRYCYCGGDVLPIEVFRRWKENFGISIYQVYGSTEAGHVATADSTGSPNSCRSEYRLRQGLQGRRSGHPRTGAGG